MEIRKVQDEETFLCALLYGGEGSGKTTLAATAPGDILIANVEGGTASVRSFPGVYTTKVTNANEVLDVGRAVAFNKEYKNINTLVVDSLTELVEYDLKFLVKQSKKKSKDRKRSDDDRYLEDYGRMTTRIRRVVRELRDMPIHVIFTALAKEVRPPKKKPNDPERPPTSVEPFITNKLGLSLRGMVDYLWYMYVDKDENPPVHYMLTKQHGIVKAKTRGPRFANSLGQVVKISLEITEAGQVKVSPTLEDLYKQATQLATTTPQLHE